MNNDQQPMNPNKPVAARRLKLILMCAGSFVLVAAVTAGLLSWLVPRPQDVPLDATPAQAVVSDSDSTTQRAYAALYAQDHAEALRLFKEARELAVAEGRSTSEITSIDEQIELVERQLKLEADNTPAAAAEPPDPANYHQEVIDGVTYVIPNGAQLAH